MGRSAAAASTLNWAASSNSMGRVGLTPAFFRSLLLAFYRQAIRVFVARSRRLSVDLLRDGGLVMRYDTEDGVDGLPPGEGAFLACSFWLADNYILQRRFGDARVLFERLLALRNDLGLLAEEYDPRAGRMLGNFPQAFSHVGLINTAIKLARVEPEAAKQSDRVS